MSRFVAPHRRLYRLVSNRERTSKEWRAEQSNASRQPPERPDCTPLQAAEKTRHGNQTRAATPHGMRRTNPVGSTSPPPNTSDAPALSRTRLAIAILALRDAVCGLVVLGFCPRQ